LIIPEKAFKYMQLITPGAIKTLMNAANFAKDGKTPAK
jgi:hypothetical protein